MENDIVTRLVGNTGKYQGFQNMNTEAAATITDLRKELSAKDETIRVLREALDDMHFAYVNKDADCLHDFEVAAIEKYKALAAAAKGGEKP